MMNLGGSGSSR